MANDTTTVQDDPKQLADAQSLWVTFIKSSKISIVATALVLIALLIAFVPFGG